MEDLRKSSPAAAGKGEPGAASEETATTPQGPGTGRASSEEALPEAGPQAASAQQADGGASSSGQGAQAGSSKAAGEQGSDSEPKAGASGFMARLQSITETVRREVPSLNPMYLGLMSVLRKENTRPSAAIDSQHFDFSTADAAIRVPTASLTAGMQKVLNGMSCRGSLQVAAAILPDENFSSALRAHSDELRAPATQTGGAVAVIPETRWQKQWKEMQDKVCLITCACRRLMHALMQQHHSVRMPFRLSGCMEKVR